MRSDRYIKVVLTIIAICQLIGAILNRAADPCFSTGDGA